jgi:hypothetical protein
MVESSDSPEAGTMDVAKGSTTAGAVGLWVWTGSIALWIVAALLLLIYGFSHISGSTAGSVIGRSIFFLLPLAGLAWLGWELALAGSAMMASSASRHAGRVAMAAGATLCAVGALGIYSASSNAGLSRFLSPTILFLLAGLLVIVASMLSRNPARGQHVMAGGFGVGAAILIVVAGAQVGSLVPGTGPFGGAITGGGTSASFVGATTSPLMVGPVAALCYIIAAVAVLVTALLATRASKPVGLLILCFGVLIFSIIALVNMSDYLGRNPWNLSSDGLLATASVLMSISVIAVGAAGLAGILTAVLGIVTQGQSLAANASWGTPTTGASPVGAGRTTRKAATRAGIFCNACGAPMASGARFCGNCGTAA